MAEIIERKVGKMINGVINEVDIIDDIAVLFRYKVIFYGAGKQGERMLNELKNRGASVHFFCDSAPDKWGHSINGVKIISPQELKELDDKEKIVIIITSERPRFVEQIIETLEALELRTDFVATLFGLRKALKQNRKHFDGFLPNEEYTNAKWEAVKKTLEIQNWRINHLSQFMKANGILVYQPGKVGSQTVCASLYAAGVTTGIYDAHLHTLNYPGMETIVKEAIQEKLESLESPIKIITLIREPINRDLAHVFQIMGYAEVEIPFFSGSFTEVCSKRLEKMALEGDWFFGRCSNQFGYQFEWFDNEIKEIFGVDIFDEPFDKEKGYSVIKKASVEILIIKLERLNFMDSVIGKFVGAPNFKITNLNESTDKPYRYLYDNVKKAIKIPNEIVRLYYTGNSRMNHFYTEEERAAFLKKWEDNID